MERKHPHPLRRLHARMHANRVTGLMTKVVVTFLGLAVLMAGVVMMVTPGPGIVAIILGLVILSTEWDWAERWVDRTRAYAHETAERARQLDPAVRRRRIALTVVAVIGVVAVLSLIVHQFGWPGFVVDGWDLVQGLSSRVPELPGM